MPACVAADPPACSARLPTPVDAVGSDLGEAFGGTNLLWYAGAVGASAAMAFGGGDRAVRDVVQEHLASSGYGTGASLAGYVLALSVAPGVWLTGVLLDDRTTAGAGSAAIQALAFSAATTVVLKIGVGRLYPSADAHTFTPFQGWSWPFLSWPSGHMSSLFAVVGSLTAYYGADELWIPFVGYPAAAAIGLGLLSGDEHWASDLIAGAVLGQCIGWSVGRAFRARARGDQPSGLTLTPTILGSAPGLVAGMTW